MREQYTIKSNLLVGDCISPSFNIIIKKSIFFYKRLLETDAINSLLFFKDVFLDWIPVFIYSILDIVAYFGAANLDNFLIIASKTFLDHKLLIILILVTRQQRTGRCRRAYSCAVADKQRRKKSVLYWRCEMLVADPGPDM